MDIPFSFLSHKNYFKKFEYTESFFKSYPKVSALQSSFCYVVVTLDTFDNILSLPNTPRQGLLLLLLH
ncbi:unnamed protein product [Schistosoma rodhaini]|uniref:Uncharacterized protein n=1 Tax=Schistosoma rodhaini TaxID=6188 RepID=A0AA85F9F2_9TREM|nr:unnamed protein product [Schistosoma rodhaini]CAH8493314.1 unnamed protein product [Schistosoma rodhaini]